MLGKTMTSSFGNIEIKNSEVFFSFILHIFVYQSLHKQRLMQLLIILMADVLWKRYVCLYTSILHYGLSMHTLICKQTRTH